MRVLFKKCTTQTNDIAKDFLSMSIFAQKIVTSVSFLPDNFNRLLVTCMIPFVKGAFVTSGNT